MSNLTNDEIAECIQFLTIAEGDGVPNAELAREMAEEVLQLRARLTALEPLERAALLGGDREVIDAAKTLAYERAQAQDGAA